MLWSHYTGQGYINLLMMMMVMVMLAKFIYSTSVCKSLFYGLCMFYLLQCYEQARLLIFLNSLGDWMMYFCTLRLSHDQMWLQRTLLLILQNFKYRKWMCMSMWNIFSNTQRRDSNFHLVLFCKVVQNEAMWKKLSNHTSSVGAIITSK
jgi:hypothetical protein